MYLVERLPIKYQSYSDNVIAVMSQVICEQAARSQLCPILPFVNQQYDLFLCVFVGDCAAPLLS
jgi:hypothetical protein